MSNLKMLFGVILLIASILWGLSIRSIQKNNYEQYKERETLIASYLRLGDILKGLSATICQEIGTLSPKNASEIKISCEQMDSIVIKLKVAPQITEQDRDYYNQLLSNLTENLFEIARKNKDTELAQKIDIYKSDINKQMAIVKNKNLKLTYSISQNELQIQRYKNELQTIQNEKQTAEQQYNKVLAQYQAERDAAINSQKRLQNELLKMQQERDELKNIAKNVIETKPDKAVEATPPPKPAIISEIPSPALPTPNEPEKDTKITTKDQLKKQLSNDLMVFSEIKRNRELRQRLIEYFAIPDSKSIQIEDVSYSINEYADKLSLLGPFNVVITDLKTDKQGKITQMKITETRLQKNDSE